MLTDESLPLEFLMNALRLKQGVERELFSRHTGLPQAKLDETLAKAGDLGLIEDNSEWLRTTPGGFDHLNGLLERLL